jgi:hypothetical protein
MPNAFDHAHRPRWLISQMASIDVREQADRESVEDGAATRRRLEIFRHRQPYAKLELESRRQLALEVAVTPRQGRLANADSEPRSDRHQLRKVAVRPEGEMHRLQPLHGGQRFGIGHEL